MHFESFIEGPLLWISLLIFIIGIITRLTFFSSAIIQSSMGEKTRLKYILTIIGRFLFPFHRAFIKRPIYTTLRYLFHICLIAVPVWYGGHIILWEFSRFEWNWSALPYEWADRMTLLLLGLATYFLVRRITVPEIRFNSSKSDYFLIFITALPFLTGYFLTHDTSESISFLGDNMRSIHVLSGEAMLIAIPFLFYKTQLNAKKCTGCAACELSCPTGTLISKDEGKFRTFIYSHYQCICCAACVKTCPEKAAELRHEISSKSFFQLARKQKVQSVELRLCKNCGTYYAPEPQLNRILKTYTDDYILLCSRCRRANRADILYQLFEEGSRKGSIVL